MKIEAVSIDHLIPYARNSRTHDDAQVAQIAASIREFGFTNPVLIDGDSSIIAGHGRLLAARKLGLKEVPCIRLTHLSESQRRAYVIADNKLALNSGWDDEMLKLELSEIQGLDFNVDVLGFSGDELASILTEATEGQCDPDSVPEVSDTAVSVLGDVWILGNHRLVCGDSTDADVVAKSLNGVAPHLMVTDPPYGVEYDPAWRDEKEGAESGRAKGKVLNDNEADWREAWLLFPGAVAYVWHAGLTSHSVTESLVASGFSLRSQIVWVKSNFALGRGDYHWQHEACWYAVKQKKAGSWNGDRKQTTVWQIPKTSKSENGHSTQKPVECMKRPIENNSSPGQAVYEPFSGSGTTIIAGEMTGRNIHAIELHPAYVDIAVKRWQEFSGKNAVHEATGKTFNELSDANGEK